MVNTLENLVDHGSGYFHHRKWSEVCPICTIERENAALEAERDEWRENAEVHLAENVRLFNERDGLRCKLAAANGRADEAEAKLALVVTADIEGLAESVHRAYCANYLARTGAPYWTNGDYSRLDDETKEIDRATVRAVLDIILANTPEVLAVVDGQVFMGSPGCMMDSGLIISKPQGNMIHVDIGESGEVGQPVRVIVVKGGA